MKAILLSLAMVCLGINLTAQFEQKEWHYGPQVGLTQSSMTQVKETIIRPVHPVETYTTTIGKTTGYSAGMFFHYHFEDSKFALHPEIEFSTTGSLFSYSDINELAYEMKFTYTYMSIAPKINIYLAKGFNLLVGPKLGFIVDDSNLQYLSNMPELGPDLQIQSSLREVLKGKNNFSFSISFGYDFPFGLMVKAGYDFGLKDTLETLANGFYFTEQRNSTQATFITLGYAIPFYK